jgi:hypothetical protein
MTLCILHLGSEKTGTSSLQKFLGTGREALLAQGFWYPKSFTNPGGHVHLRLSSAALRDALSDSEPDVAAFRDEYARVMKERRPSAAIFSSEFFHSEMRSAESVARLKRFLEGYFNRFQLVYYARRQDLMLASMHSTAVRGGWTADENALSIYESKGRYYFDHLAVCDLWAGQFGRDNLVCRIYERDKLVKGDIVDDFAAVVGLKVDSNRPRVSSNESLSFETLAALLLLNRSVRKDDAVLRRRLIMKGNRRAGARIPMLTKEDARRFLESFAETNRKFFMSYIDKSLAEGFTCDFSGFPDALPKIPQDAIRALTPKQRI